MEKSNAIQGQPQAGGCNPILTLGGRVSQKTGMIVLAVAAVGSGLAFGWDSLAALGLTTVIVSLLPCLVMCGAGICMSRMGKQQTDGNAAAVPPKAAQPAAGETVQSNAADKAVSPSSTTAGGG